MVYDSKSCRYIGRRHRRTRAGGAATATTSRRRRSATPSNTNELEEKVIGLYAKGPAHATSSTLHELTGLSCRLNPSAPSPTSTVAGRSVARPLEAVYPFVFLDALHLKLRREGKIENTRSTSF